MQRDPTVGLTFFLLILLAGQALFPPTVTSRRAPDLSDMPPPGPEIGAQRVVAIAPVLTGYVTIDQSTEHVVATSDVALNAGSGFAGLLQEIYPSVRDI